MLNFKLFNYVARVVTSDSRAVAPSRFQVAISSFKFKLYIVFKLLRLFAVTISMVHRYTQAQQGCTCKVDFIYLYMMYMMHYIMLSTGFTLEK